MWKKDSIKTGSGTLRSFRCYRTWTTGGYVASPSAMPKFAPQTSHVPRTLGEIFEGSLFSNLDSTRCVEKLLNKLNLSDYHG